MGKVSDPWNLLGKGTTLNYEELLDSETERDTWIHTLRKKLIFYFNYYIFTKEKRKTRVDAKGLSLHSTILIIILTILAYLFTQQTILYLQSFTKPKGPDAETVGSSVIQGIHQLSVMMTTFISLALPITANLYTPRFVEIFLKDSVNMLFLCTFGVFSSVSVFTDSIVFNLIKVEVIPYSIFASFSIIGWAVIIPYYFYVLRFLNPEVIVDSVGKLVEREIEFTTISTFKPAIARLRINRIIVQLGEIGEKAAGRSDRQTTILTINELISCLNHYLSRRSLLSHELFEFSQSEFPFLSQSGVNWITNKNYWVEEQFIRQIHKIYSSCLLFLPAMISFISLSGKDNCSQIITQNEHRPLLTLWIRLFNTFLAEAMESRQSRAFHNVFYQYIQLCKVISKQYNEYLPFVIRYILHYFTMCREMRMCEAVIICNYHLCSFSLFLFRSHNQYRDFFLTKMLSIISITPEEENEQIRPMERSALLKSRIILGTSVMYLSHLMKEDYSRYIMIVAERLAFATPAEIDKACLILSSTEQLDFEVSDNIVSFDFIPRKHRLFLKQFKNAVNKREDLALSEPSLLEEEIDDLEKKFMDFNYV